MQPSINTTIRKNDVYSYGIREAFFSTISSKKVTGRILAFACRQRFSSVSASCSFTGKELDSETGYGYHGARYMDYELLTSFISVDRYADKYPSISPYIYCAWNPIRLTDPTGDTICFEYNNKKYYYMKTNKDYYFWVNNEGKMYSGGDNVELDKLTDALRMLQKKTIGNELINRLINDNRTVRINVWRNNNKSDADNGAWIFWNPDKTKGNFLNSDGTNTRPSFIGLAHELAHIDETWHGTNDMTEWFKDPISSIVVPMCEKVVCAVENKIRSEHNVSLREYYFYYVDEKRCTTYKYGPLLNN